jgi:hypothetical protein
VPIFTEKLDLGAIFEFRDFQKGTVWPTFSRKFRQKSKVFPPGTLLELTFPEHRFLGLFYWL